MASTSQVLITCLALDKLARQWVQTFTFLLGCAWHWLVQTSQLLCSLRAPGIIYTYCYESKLHQSRPTYLCPPTVAIPGDQSVRRGLLATQGAVRTSISNPVNGPAGSGLLHFGIAVLYFRHHGVVWNQMHCQRHIESVL